MSLLMVSEHSGISVNDLTYNIPSLELFSIWNSVIKKIELLNEQKENQK